MFDWSDDYVCLEHDIGCHMGEAYKFRNSPLIIGNPTGCGIMIYNDKYVIERGFSRVTQDDFEQLAEIMIELQQADRLPANTNIGIKTACCS